MSWNNKFLPIIRIKILEPSNKIIQGFFLNAYKYLLISDSITFLQFLKICFCAKQPRLGIWRLRYFPSGGANGIAWHTSWTGCKNPSALGNCSPGGGIIISRNDRGCEEKKISSFVILQLLWRLKSLLSWLLCRFLSHRFFLLYPAPYFLDVSVVNSSAKYVVENLRTRLEIDISFFFCKRNVYLFCFWSQRIVKICTTYLIFIYWLNWWRIC